MKLGVLPLFATLSALALAPSLAAILLAVPSARPPGLARLGTPGNLQEHPASSPDRPAPPFRARPGAGR